MRYTITFEVMPALDTRPSDLTPKELAKAVLRSDIQPVSGYGVQRGAHEIRFVDAEVVGLADLRAVAAARSPQAS